MFSQIIGRICKSILDLIVAGAAALRISPNILTLQDFWSRWFQQSTWRAENSFKPA